MQIANFHEFKPRSGGEPRQMVILLHGLGSDGQDLIGLAPEFSRLLPEAVFISPDAPFRCDMAPMGYQWFSLQDWSLENMLKGVRTATPILHDFMEAQLKKYGLPSSRLALAGFSQGTMMSLYAGPRYKDPIAGILGYSGALIGEADWSTQSPHNVPVHLVHGEADTVVPVSAYRHAHMKLTEHGFKVSGGTTPRLAHGIDQDGIKSGAEFLQSILK